MVGVIVIFALRTEETVARVQEIHELCLHGLAAWLERRLCSGDGEGGHE